MKIGTMFSGGGGVDIGAMSAGLTPVWAIEYAAAIADVYRRNLGDHVITASVNDVDPSTLEWVDVLHASPPCPNFSIANNDGIETADDIVIADSIVRFIRVLKPRIFTLENVYGYRKSKSWQRIETALHECGYWLAVDHVDASDYGVPQARKRMIVRATMKAWVPHMPPVVRPKIGWLEAVADIVDDFPLSELAPWQIKSLPETMTTFLAPSANAGRGGDFIKSHLPASTLTDCYKNPIRAILINGGQTEIASDGGRTAMLRRKSEPSYTLRACRYEPPSVIQGATVRKFTVQGLARLQTFPDWYEWPDSKSLSGRIIGNAVPCKLYETIVRSLI